MKYNVYIRDGLNKEFLLDEISKKYPDSQISDSPEIVFTLGGDGTFLDALHLFGTTPVYIPINKGTLGFYTSWLFEELDEITEELKNPNIVHANMLEVSFVKNNIECRHLCLNEATIINPVSTQILDIYINDIQLEKFRGTGVCISTPTGSTAYNKSLGGAIISSDKELFQLIHIAAINNSKYRTLDNPIIFGKSETLSLVTNNDNFKHTILTIDRKTYSLRDIDMLNIKLSDEKLKLLVRSDNNFYERVKKSFLC